VPKPPNKSIALACWQRSDVAAVLSWRPKRNSFMPSCRQDWHRFW
ncbi:hypothetical protein scyTo_0015860, partial [Scyliorhinus torazame]|nr:hypothetical protein [Scyliorhinus torazame]